ncbi:ribulokinase [Alteromonas sp. KUL49]|nr:ribulokinase [Alteromonas sp. KUL49]
MLPEFYLYYNIIKLQINADESTLFMGPYAIGLDFGSDSVRALLVDVTSGEEVSTSVVNYPRWSKGMFCEPQRDQFRQHPLDYLESTELVIQSLWQVAPKNANDNIIGLSIDTTGSTPIAVDENGQALALKPEFVDNPNAMFVLWKDHTAISEAEEITRKALSASTNYLKYEGSIYSSEWYWAKALHVMRNDKSVANQAHMWVEHCDWLPAVLTGTTHPSELRLGRCAAGHKMMWHENWGGFPPNDFFVSVDPLLDGLVNRLPSETFCSDQAVGCLTSEWAHRLSLPKNLPIGFGAFDCHMGAVAANVEEGVLTKVMGTSTCDITVCSPDTISSNAVNGICGQVEGSVVPNMVGLEAGQSAFGDFYAWFQRLINATAVSIVNSSDSVTEEQKRLLIQALNDQTLIALSQEAQNIPREQTSVLALDWVNGRRTPDANQHVAAAITGLKLGTSAAHVFRALVEATAFGAKAIIERFTDNQIPIRSVVAIGGISKKSDLVMQTCADIWNRPIQTLKSDQSCALGAAIFAAKIGGAYKSVADAQRVMASPVAHTYTPNPDAVSFYKVAYQSYKTLGQFVEDTTL